MDEHESNESVADFVNRKVRERLADPANEREASLRKSNDERLFFRLNDLIEQVIIMDLNTRVAEEYRIEVHRNPPHAFDLIAGGQEMRLQVHNGEIVYGAPGCGSKNRVPSAEVDATLVNRLAKQLLAHLF